MNRNHLSNQIRQKEGYRTRTHKHCLCMAAVLCILSLLTVGTYTADTLAAEQTNGEIASPFTALDSNWEYDSEKAVQINLEEIDSDELLFSDGGVFILQGQFDGSIVVDADKNQTVQLILNGVEINNDTQAAIYVRKAGKVILTLAPQSENRLTNEGTFAADGDVNIDGVIFSRDNLVINGEGILQVISHAGCGIVSKDHLLVAGGSISVQSMKAGLEANETICLSDAAVTVVSDGKGIEAEGGICLESGAYDLTCTDDGIHTEASLIFNGGDLTIQCGDDAIHGKDLVQINSGTMSLTASEGIEGTRVEINDGTINICAGGDGINAANKSEIYQACAQIRGGTLTICLTEGDNDGIDSNGDLIISGGVIDISNAENAFDYKGSSEYTGGIIIVDGEVVNEIVNQIY